MESNGSYCLQNASLVSIKCNLPCITRGEPGQAGRGFDGKFVLPVASKTLRHQGQGKRMPTLLVLLLLCYVILSKNSFFIALPPKLGESECKGTHFFRTTKIFSEKNSKKIFFLTNIKEIKENYTLLYYIGGQECLRGEQGWNHGIKNRAGRYCMSNDRL